MLGPVDIEDWFEDSAEARDARADEPIEPEAPADRGRVARPLFGAVSPNIALFAPWFRSGSR